MDQPTENEWRVVVTVDVGIWSTASFCSCPHIHIVGAVTLLTKFRKKVSQNQLGNIAGATLVRKAV